MRHKRENKLLAYLARNNSRISYLILAFQVSLSYNQQLPREFKMYIKYVSVINNVISG